MANIKSQKKRVLTNAKANLKNSAEKSKLKTAIKKVKEAIAANDKEAATKAFNEANSQLDKIAVGRVRHDNYVARNKSKLAKAIAKMK